MKKYHLLILTLLHICIICLSNILVAYPLTLLGYHTTYGAFSYPFIFILTDLTTRLTTAKRARQIIFLAMFPGLIASLLIINNASETGTWLQNTIGLRIAFASFFAYLLGQLIDIFFFQKLRQQALWWVAPSVATIFGNLLDTYCFFFIAFYQSNHVFMSTHWLEIATVDLIFKIAISLISFIPLYGLLLTWFLARSSAPFLRKSGPYAQSNIGV